MIPEELRLRRQWVGWTFETRDDKITKVPRQLNGSRASTTDPATWASFEEVKRAARRFDGIGFVFTKDDPYVGVDLDACIVDGVLHPEAKRVVEKLDSYTELSPSGTGVHIIVKAKLNSTRNSTTNTPWGGKLEVYDHGRYFTVTGKRLQ